MPRSAILVALFAACGALIPAACTQNFDAFDVNNTGGGPATSSGGGVAVTSTSASGIGGAGPSTTASVSVSSTSATGSGVPEIACNDGVDNDSDGRPDCEDADCTGDADYECASVPTGWQGPIALAEGNPDDLPDCPDAFPDKAFALFDDLSAQAPSCNACTCAPLAVTCAPQQATFFSEDKCTTTGVPIDQKAECQTFSKAAGVLLPKPTATAAAACTPAGGGMKDPLPEPSWGKAALGCALPQKGAGCDGTQTCAPPLPKDFDKLCIYKTGGEGSCPNAYPDKRLYYGGFKDDRGCSACSCGAPGSAASCTATTSVFLNGNCAGGGIDFPNDGDCHSGSPFQVNGSFKVTTAATAPTCPQSGGKPTGSAAPDAATVTMVCCAK